MVDYYELINMRGGIFLIRRPMVIFSVSFIIALFVVTSVGYLNNIYIGVSIDWVENATIMQKLAGYLVNCFPFILLLALIVALIPTGIVILVNKIKG